MKSKIDKYKNKEITKAKFFEIYQGWRAYSEWADSSNVRKRILKEISAKNSNY